MTTRATTGARRVRSGKATTVGSGGNVGIEKTPDSQIVVSGDTATFTINVTNTGNVDLTDVEVTDTNAPDCDSTIGALAAGASIVEYTCTVANVTSGCL